MRCLVQRVSRASVTVEGQEVGAIGPGLLAFVGMMEGDEDADLVWTEKKLLSLRVFADDAGKMNRNVIDVGGSVLLVSQFTLAGNVAKGARPSFVTAMRPELAEAMLSTLCDRLRGSVPIATGRFRTHMEVSLVNDGPVTLWLDSRGQEGRA